MDYMSYIRAIRSSDLPSNARLTAIIIASHFDFSKGDPAFPSNKLLAKETGLSISTIVRAKRVLSERAYLYSQMRWDNSCEYTPMLPESRPYSHGEKLNTHINTHINTNINTHRNMKDSNESLVINNINIKPEDILVLEEQSSAAAARIIEEDWLSW